MKSLLLILFISFTAFGQQTSKKVKASAIPKPAPASLRALTCDDYTYDSYDKIKGTSTIAGRKQIVVSDDGDSGFLFFLVQGRNDLIVSITVIGNRHETCVNEKSEINILFEDDSRMTLYGDQDFNCDGNVRLYFGGAFGRLEELKKLTTKKIKAMRVHTYKSSVDSDFSNAQATEIFNQLNCLKENSHINAEAQVIQPSKEEAKSSNDSEPKSSGIQPASPKTESIPEQSAKIASTPQVPRVISGGVLNGKAISLPKPLYSKEAKSSRASGTVQVQVRIDEQGNVVSAKALSGNPLLFDASEKAALNAKFPTTQLSGSFVQVTGIIVYNFIP